MTTQEEIKAVVQRLTDLADNYFTPGRFIGDGAELQVSFRKAAALIERLASERASVADAQDEILQACCNALDKAHSLLDFIVRYDGKVTPEFVEKCREWIDGEYDPGERAPKPCAHNWVKAALDNSMWCSRCGIERREGCQ